MNTLEQVKALIGDKAGIPAADVQDDAWLGSARSPMTNGTQHLDLDSADCLEVTMALEEHFGIEISDAQAEKAEMGTPAGIAAYVREVKGHVIDETFGERGPFGQIIDTPAESVDDIPEATTREYQRGFTAGYAAARPLDPGVIHIGEGSANAAWRLPDIFKYRDDEEEEKLVVRRKEGAQHAFIIPRDWSGKMAYCNVRVIQEGAPITREELMERGLAEDLGGAVMDIVMKLGFPTEDNPMGTEATHMLIPLDPRATEEEATEVLSYRNWVKFLRIERVEPMEQIHFDHPAAETPEWLIEACSLPSGDAGAVWAENGVLFASTPAGHVPVKPGQIINHSLVSQLQISDPVEL